MMNLPDDMLPEERELQYAELITLLQQTYSKPVSVSLERQQQILLRVRERLAQTDPGTSLTEDMPVFANGRLDPPMSKTEARAGKQYQQFYVPPSPPLSPVPESSLTRPYQPGTVPSSVINQQDRRDPRFASIITVLVLTATLLLLGFSIYLVAELGFINLPFINNQNQSDIISVPNLDGLSYQKALVQAMQAGFNLRSQDGSQAGVVIGQVPRAADTALKGSTITVQMGQLTPTSTPTPTLTVPPHLVGNSLAGAEQILKNANIPYMVKSAGPDPTKGPNIVKSVSPSEGSPLPSGQSVTLFVVNLTNDTPIATPSPTTTPSPTPVGSTPIPIPTRNPTPTPTAYNGQIMLTSTVGSLTLPTTFIMGQPTTPIMGITPASMTFTGVVGQPNPPLQAMTITNSGAGTLFWQSSVTTAVGGPWLTIDQGSGSIASQQSTSINVSAAVIAKLIPGAYTDTITITATDDAGHATAGSPQSISVVLIVVRH